MITTILANVGILLIAAVLTESLTEIVKNVFPEGVIRDKSTYGVSIAIGIILAYAFGINLFGLAGIGLHVSTVAAGLIASRGANFVNGLVKKLGIIKTSTPAL